MVASASSMAAMVGLLTALLSTTALAAAPEAGEALPAETGMAPPEVRPLPETTISGQRFAADDRVLDLLLRDGTSLTLARGGALSIDEFAFDPAARIARLHLTLERGLLRVGGGRPAFAEPVVVTTPGGEAKLAQGVGLLWVDPDGTTRADLLTGGPLSLTAAGQTEEVVRPGFETLATRGAPPQSAERRAEGAMEFYMTQLNPGLLSAISPGPGPAPSSGQATAATDTLDFIQANLTEATTPTVSLSGAGTGSIAGGSAFTPTLQALSNTTGLTDSINDDPEDILAQDQRFNTDGSPDLRAKGLTSSVFFFSNEPFAQSLANEPRPTNSFGDPASPIDLVYVFGTQSDDPEVDSSDKEIDRLVLTSNPPTTSDRITDSEFFFEPPTIGVGDNHEFAQDRVLVQFQLATQGSPDVDGLAEPISSVFTASGVVPASSVGLDEFTLNASIPGRIPFTVATLLNGFSARVELVAIRETPLVLKNLQRLPDNFLMAEVRPAISTQGGREALKNEYFRLRNLAEAGSNTTGFNNVRIGLMLAFDVLDLTVEKKLFGDPDNFDFSSESIKFTDDLAELLTGQGTLESRIQGAGFLDEGQKKRALEQTAREGRYLFAAGDVDGPLDSGRRLDTFFISPGLEGFDETTGRPPDGVTVASIARAFLRNTTAFSEDPRGLGLADTGLLVIGSPAATVAGNSDEQIGVLHADFGLRGQGSDQQSTISVTVGDVEYGKDTPAQGGGLDDPGDNEVVLQARTVGSSQADSHKGSVLASTALFNTAAGGGNERVQGAAGESRAGYFVIENFEPDVALAETGGSERPMGQNAAEPDVQFAVLRLATGIGSQDMALSASESQTVELGGFAAGLSELEPGGTQVNVAAIDTGDTPDGLRLQLDPKTNRIEATFNLTNSGTVTMGGLAGEDSRGASAYIDGDRFGARTTNSNSTADTAMVSGELLRQAANVPGSTANDDTKGFLNAMPRTTDLKWGFFFGDLDPGGTDGLRRHVHLGTWVAGNVPDGSRLPAHGTARYEGGAIGNVVNAGALYSAAGKYTNTWNFGSRAGLTELNFDGARMSGFTQQQGSRAVFTGGLSGDGRTAGIAGSFVQGAEPAGVPPAGQMGRFTVSGNNYGAAGVFGATKQ